MNVKEASLNMLSEAVRGYCHCNIISPAYNKSYRNNKTSLKDYYELGKIYAIDFINYHKKFKGQITPSNLFCSLTLKTDINYQEIGDEVFYPKTIYKLCKEILEKQK